jgi:uncharacterized protein
VKIRLGEVTSKERVYEGEEPSEIAVFPPEIDINVVAPITYRFRVVKIPEMLIVRGELSTLVTCRCRRCDEPLRHPLQEDGFERIWQLSPDGLQWTARLDDGVEEPPQPGLDGTPPVLESVDLTEDIREAIILTFSGYPLCRPDCRGLCTTCGVNLNNATCDCAPPPDQRWDALDGWGAS